MERDLEALPCPGTPATSRSAGSARWKATTLHTSQLLLTVNRIISGHHRVEAAIKVGIVEADCLSIEGDVDEGRLTAIQLSHNSLAGEDDPEVLRQMLESLLPLERLRRCP